MCCALTTLAFVGHFASSLRAREKRDSRWSKVNEREKQKRMKEKRMTLGEAAGQTHKLGHVATVGLQ